MAVLDKMRTELMNRSATTIQRHMKGFIARSQYRRTRRAAITLQVSRSTAPILFLTPGPAADNLSTRGGALHPPLMSVPLSKCKKPSVLFVSGIQAASEGEVDVVQAGARGMAARAEARRRRHTHAATVVQAALRMHLARQQYLHTRRAIITIQAGYRGRAARRYTKDIRSAPVGA